MHYLKATPVLAADCRDAHVEYIIYYTVLMSISLAVITPASTSIRSMQNDRISQLLLAFHVEGLGDHVDMALCEKHCSILPELIHPPRVHRNDVSLPRRAGHQHCSTRHAAIGVAGVIHHGLVVAQVAGVDAAVAAPQAAF
jgi:hypothetical protein